MKFLRSSLLRRLCALGLAAIPTLAWSQTSWQDVLAGGSGFRVPGLINLSVRSTLARNEALIAGFVIQGPSHAGVLVRGVGPALTAFGVFSAMANPRLQVFDSNGRVVAENDEWSLGSVHVGWSVTGAFPLPAGSHDAEIFVTLPPGAYTLVVSGSTSTDAGVVLGEVYHTPVTISVPGTSTPPVVGPMPARLTNLSVRGRVVTMSPPSLSIAPAASSMIGGFVVSNPSPLGTQRYLIRVIGPALAQFGVSDSLVDPTLELAGTNGTIIQTNDNWDSDANAATTIREVSSAVGAFPLPAGSRDAAIVARLPDGAYTVIARGVNGATGSVLIEVYEFER